MSEAFFAALPAFADPRDLCDPRHYREIPDGWVVVISDVEGSTKAIEEGRYRDVNLIGAATITAARNALPGLELPYVFGGDGATMLVPAAHVGRVRDALLGVQALAHERFDLGLRVGGVSTDELHREGASVQVAKLEITAGVFLAMFSGGGLSIAERKVKDDPSYLYRSDGAPQPDLSGLHCRWRPLVAENGEMLSVLVRATPQPGEPPAAVYRTVIDEIAALVGRHDDLNPVRLGNLHLTSGPADVRREQRLQHPRGASLLARAITVLRVWLVTHIGGWLMRRRRVTASTDWGRYKDSIPRHSDFWKYDDVLRFVIDVTAAQKDALVACFEALEQKGRIVYGVHAAREAVMTCVVHDYDTNHVHFIDGGDGGYARAAKQMKAKRG